MLELQTESVRAVAGGRNVALLAFLVAVLRWPDRALAIGFVLGFAIVGDIATSSIFRQVEPQTLRDMEKNFFGEPAAATVEEILRSPPPRDVQDIYDLTMEEIKKGYSEPLKTYGEIWMEKCLLV